MNTVIEDSRNLALLLNQQPLPSKLDLEAWDRLYEIAAKEWLIGALANAINQLPKELQPTESALVECANEVFEFQKQRENKLRNQIININTALNDYGPVLWLKGADDLLQNTPSNPGIRWMMDLDCLLPEKNVKNAWLKLVKNGYEIGFQSEYEYFHWLNNDWHHAPKIVANDSDIAIEIHRYIGRDYTRDILTEIDFTLRAKKVVDGSGQPCWVLNANDGLIHRILHTQVMDQTEVRHILRVRYLFNLCLYIQKHKQEIDWESVKNRLEQSGYGDTLKRTIYLLGWLFNEKTPLYNPDCILGQQFLKYANQNHDPSFTNRFKKAIKLIPKIFAETLSPKIIELNSSQKPQGLGGWITAYLSRIFLLFKKVFSLTAWRKRINNLSKFDW